MKILVEHEIPYYDRKSEYCVGPGDFWGNPVCKYHTHRNRTHGRKAPTEYSVPKCTLFDEWLSENYKRCEKCLEAIKRVQETED